MHERDKQVVFPTPQHRDAALYAADFFISQSCVDAILLTCSCARGKAVPQSCVDISVLVGADSEAAMCEELLASWAKTSQDSPIIMALGAHGPYAHVDIDITNGDFQEGYHGWCSGPDEFELEIGNLLAYSVSLYETSAHLNKLKSTWLPYYSVELRKRRLAMVGQYCLNNIDHVAPYVDRQLFFQAFRRLYNAMGEFLQALFIARSTYPIAYDKWIKEQLVEILALPDLYPQLVDLLSLKPFESSEMKDKAVALRSMFDEHCVADGLSSDENIDAGK